MNTRQAKLETPHTPDTDYHYWVCIPGYNGTPTTVYRDSIGRRHPHSWRSWLVLICNNTECAGRAIVPTALVDEVANELVPCPPFLPAEAAE